VVAIENSGEGSDKVFGYPSSPSMPATPSPMGTPIHTHAMYAYYRCRVSIFKQLDETGGFFSGVFEEAQLFWNAADYQLFKQTALQMQVTQSVSQHVKNLTPRLTFLLCAIQVTTKLAGSHYRNANIAMHYFKIAACSMRNCIYWGEIMSNCRDIQAIMGDEGLDPGYHASDEDDGGKPEYEESEEEEEEEDDEDLDNQPLIQQKDSSSDPDDDMPLTQLAKKGK
jgi:hypothetical protein